jgi:hypothetical protein
VDPFSQYPMLEELLRPFWLRHRKTLGLVIAAIAAAGHARSFFIAAHVARWQKVRLDSAVNRFYRLLRNPRIDYLTFASAWIRLLSKGRKPHLIVSIDWTEWHHDLRMLVAATAVGKRAIPIFTQATRKLVGLRSQNSYENTFLRVLASIFKQADATVTILCDRGFRRVSWINPGRAAAQHDPSLRLVCKKKGPRQSYVTIGLQIMVADIQAIVLTKVFLKKWLEPPQIRSLNIRGIGGAK